MDYRKLANRLAVVESVLLVIWVLTLAVAAGVDTVALLLMLLSMAVGYGVSSLLGGRHA